MSHYQPPRHHPLIPQLTTSSPASERGWGGGGGRGKWAKANPFGLVLLAQLCYARCCHLGDMKGAFRTRETGLPHMNLLHGFLGGDLGLFHDTTNVITMIIPPDLEASLPLNYRVGGAEGVA